MYSLRHTSGYALVACFVLLCCASSVVPAAARRSPADPSRTLRFLQAFAQAMPGLANTWTGTNYCDWSGIQCDNAAAGTGVRISLSGRGLTGRTPDVPNGDGVVSVVAIDLSNNAQLGGEFRKSWEALTQLQTLDLSNTAMYGEIPDKWKNMGSLRTVRISNTRACRSIPDWKSQMMPFLEEVDFSNNNLKELSNDFGTFSESRSLRSLNLRGNRFCSCLPNKWRSGLLRNAALEATPALGSSDCKRINQCSSNERKQCDKTRSPGEQGGASGGQGSTGEQGGASGGQGSTVNPSRTLRFLQAFAQTMPGLANTWTGTNYCDWSGIQCDNATAGTGVRISLGGRGLTGRTPDVPNGDDVVSVVAIDLSNNAQLGGGFQDSWAALTQLQTLDLSNTAIFGSIPSSWNAMAALRTVRISNTRACRAMPNWDADSMPFLSEVDFSNNDLRVLSISFGTFSKVGSSLQSLKLEGNSFCFCIPKTWTSGILKNAAIAATPAVMQPDCGLKNMCTDLEVGRCRADGVAGVSSAVCVSCIFAIAALLLLSY